MKSNRLVVVREQEICVEVMQLMFPVCLPASQFPREPKIADAPGDTIAQSVGRSRNRGSISGKDKIFFSSLQLRDRGPPSP
jgi:hypothetical protein